MSAAADRPAIVLDGTLADDWLLWLYYGAERPRVEIIARHACRDGRTDVFTVEIRHARKRVPEAH